MTVQNTTVGVSGSTSDIELCIDGGIFEAGNKAVPNGVGERGDSECQRAESDVLGGGDVVCHSADMSKPNNILRMIEAANKRFGSADFVVESTGVQKVELVEDFPLERWDLIVAINRNSPFQTWRATLPDNGGWTAA
ncbi:MAG: SDR family NAD(P)-dependent oxidoreductase [Pseudomonadota bacterium]